jgi:signal transduction histidine kinase
MSGWAQVVLIAVLSSGAVGVLGWLAIRRIRSLSRALLVASTTGVVAVVVGVAATARSMFLSEHDLAVAVVVCMVAGAVALATGWVLGIRVEALEQRSRDLAERSARADEAERTRRELVAWVSHDLRTPLAGIRAMTDALDDGVAPDPRRYHRQMREQVDRMASMVDDLFELSRLQSGTLHMAMEQLALQNVVSDVVSAAEPLAVAHRVRLHATADPVGTRADGKELARALSNLVVNAIRHTPHDGTVMIDAGSDADGSVLLTVTDACGGIPQPDLERVFDIGWRGTPARTPAPDDGAGLGLSIARSIVEAHDGQVTVRNVDGGCRFEVRLPPARLT